MIQHPFGAAATRVWVFALSLLASNSWATGLPDIPGRDEMEAAAARLGVALRVETLAADFSQTSAELGTITSSTSTSRYCALRLPSRERLHIDPNLSKLRHLAPETWAALTPRLQLALIQHEVAHCLDAGFFDRGVGYAERESFADGVVVMLALRDGDARFAEAMARFRGSHGSLGGHPAMTGRFLHALIESHSSGALAESFLQISQVRLEQAEFDQVLSFMGVLRTDPRWSALLLAAPPSEVVRTGAECRAEQSGRLGC